MHAHDCLLTSELQCWEIAGGLVRPREHCQHFCPGWCAEGPGLALPFCWLLGGFHGLVLHRGLGWVGREGEKWEKDFWEQGLVKTRQVGFSQGDLFVYPRVVATDASGDCCHIYMDAPTFLAWKVESRGQGRELGDSPRPLRPSCECEVASTRMVPVEVTRCGGIQQILGSLDVIEPRTLWKGD